jgi:hypothetical protein
MTAAVLSPARPSARRTGASVPAQVGLEVRKSLSTRSGLALAAVGVLLAPVVVGVVSAASTGPLRSVVTPLVLAGMLSVLVLLSLGVVSTAGEWTHGTAQTTYLLSPRRGRVLAAKAAAVALLGAALAAVAAGLSGIVLAFAEPSASWTGGGRAIAMVGVAGAVFSLIGAGVGATLGNTPAALTGVYLVDLGVLPLLQIFKPAVADAIDPGNAVLQLAEGVDTAASITTLAVWVVVALAAGAVMTRRRAVQ